MTRSGTRVAAAVLWALMSAALLTGVSCQRVDDAAGTGDAKLVKTTGGQEMVLVPGGEFQMGSSHGKHDEGPVHRVRVDPFLIDRQLVTQEQYDKLDLPNPSHFKGPDRPVEWISGTQAAAYCNARSRAEKLQPCYDEDTGTCNFKATGYRLPTEAEWE